MPIETSCKAQDETLDKGQNELKGMCCLQTLPKQQECGCDGSAIVLYLKIYKKTGKVLCGCIALGHEEQPLSWLEMERGGGGGCCGAPTIYAMPVSVKRLANDTTTGGFSAGGNKRTKL